jgi:hypothetical protein
MPSFDKPHSAKLWDVAAGKRIAVLEGHAE